MDKNKKAVALKYRMDYAAPRVVARGAGHMAQKIMDTAKDANVQFYKDAKLAEDLLRVDLGADIPPELYQIVAQVLVFIDDLDALEAMKEYGEKTE